MKTSKQEIKLAMSAGTKVHPSIVPMCMFLKAHLEYTRQNYKKAVKLMYGCGQKGSLPVMVSAPSPTNACIGFDISIDSSLPPLFFNNLGCVQFKLKKYNASSFYLSKALKENDANQGSEDSASSSAESSTGNKKGTGQSVARETRKLQILYNLGLQLLLTGKPGLAFQSFQEVALSYYRNPMVWLRLAECCIAAHVLKLREDAKSRQKSSLVWKIGGNGSTRRILLPTSGGPHKGLQLEDNEADTTNTTEESDDTSNNTTAPTSVHVGTMSLAYAAKCLRNSLALLARPLPISNNVASHSTTPSPPSSPNRSNAQPPVENEDKPTVGETELKQASLVNLAFVSLAINDPVVALDSSLELLALKPINIEVYKYLAHVYAAEALCMLNCPSQALQHLSPTILDEIFPQAATATTATAIPQASSPTLSPLTGIHPSPYSSLTSSQPFPNIARSMLYTNLACVHILKEDMAQAQVCIAQALTHQPSSTKALLLQVYLEIRKGNSDVALELLKRGRPHPKRKTKR